MVYALNAPRGLGDAIYLRAVALHLLAMGKAVKVFTRWPDVFSGMDVEFGSMAEVTALEGQKFRAPSTQVRNVMACLHCQVPYIAALDKFALACLQAGIEDEIELRIDWQVRNDDLVNRIRDAAGVRPIVVFQPLRKAHNEADEVLRPKAGAFAKYVGAVEGFKVKVGSAEFTTDDGLSCDLDLYGQTSVTDVLDVVSCADLCVAENCFLPVAAQAMNRRFVLVMARRALASNLNKVRGITPERMMQKPHLGCVVFDE
jgi:hypothetical protein